MSEGLDYSEELVYSDNYRIIAIYRHNYDDSLDGDFCDMMLQAYHTAVMQE